jgi:hypothetical protein
MGGKVSHQEVLFDYVLVQTIANLDTLINLNPDNQQLKRVRAQFLMAKFLESPASKVQIPQLTPGWWKDPSPAHKEYCAFSEVGLCTCGYNTASFKPPAAKARCVCWDNKQFCDCVEPRPQGGAKTTSAPEDSEKLPYVSTFAEKWQDVEKAAARAEVLAGPGKPWLQELVDQEKKPEPAAAPKWDFTGRWKIGNSSDVARVEQWDPDSQRWEGWIETTGMTGTPDLKMTWDEEGRATDRTRDHLFDLVSRLREGAKYR